jgi:hypothetical protein
MTTRRFQLRPGRRFARCNAQSKGDKGTDYSHSWRGGPRHDHKNPLGLLLSAGQQMSRQIPPCVWAASTCAATSHSVQGRPVHSLISASYPLFTVGTVHGNWDLHAVPWISGLAHHRHDQTLTVEQALGLRLHLVKVIASTMALRLLM